MCPICQKEFEVIESKSDQVCCSLSCGSIERCRKNPDQMKSRGLKGGLKSATSQQKRSKNEILFAQLCEDYFGNISTNEPIFNG